MLQSFIILCTNSMKIKLWFKNNGLLILFLIGKSFGSSVGTGMWEDVIIHYKNKMLLSPNQMLLPGSLTQMRGSEVSTPYICLVCHPGYQLILTICFLFSLETSHLDCQKESRVISSTMWSCPAACPSVWISDIRKAIGSAGRPKAESHWESL